jgi:hypothetical protein
MRPNSCAGCRSHYRERHWLIFEIDFCGLDGEVVGFSCPLGCIDTEGCTAYERPTAWPEGAIA